MGAARPAAGGTLQQLSCIVSTKINPTVAARVILQILLSLQCVVLKAICIGKVWTYSYRVYKLK